MRVHSSMTMRRRSSPRPIEKKVPAKMAQGIIETEDRLSSISQEELRRIRQQNQDQWALKILGFMVGLIVVALSVQSGLVSTAARLMSSSEPQESSIRPPRTVLYEGPKPYNRPQCIEACLQDISADNCNAASCSFSRTANIRAWIKQVCELDEMQSSACWLSKQCESETGGLCDSKELTYAICTSQETKAAVDKAGNALCQDYKALCVSNGKQLASCYREVPLSTLPSHADAHNAIMGMCSEMSMPGCHCHGHECAHPVQRLADLCASMNMPQCQILAPSCKELHRASGRSTVAMNFLNKLKCPQVQNFVPEMRMYFHKGTVEYVLFQGFVTVSFQSYVLTCFVIILSGLLSALLKGLRHRKQKQWDACPLGLHRSDPRCSLGMSGTLRAIAQIAFDDSTSIQVNSLAGRLLYRNTIRACFTLVISSIDYSLMLLAMTFNIGFFICILISFFMGQLLYGHWFYEDVYEPTHSKASANLSETNSGDLANANDTPGTMDRP